MPEMIIFIGIQASGKSSFYNRRLSENYVHVSLDELNTRNKEKQIIEQCINDRVSFVIDNTNPSKADRKKYFDMVQGKGYAVKGFFFRSVVRECIARNQEREGKARVPDTAVACTSNRLEMPSYDEGFDGLYYVCMKDGDFDVEEWKKDEF